MSLFARAIRRVRALFDPAGLNDDMQAEMRQHLDRATERLIARGLSPEDARLEARREFGNVTVIQEDARDARATRWLDALRGDMRFAVRYFARHKATVAIIVVVLAMGTGANALIFSIFQAEFVRPAPAVPDDDAHARIWATQRNTTTAAWQRSTFTVPELDALSQRRELFASVAGWIADEGILDGGDSTGARTTEVQYVTPNFFTTLGVPLVAGQGWRAGAAQTEDADMTAVMAYAVAERLYGSPANAIGKQILVNEVPLRIVGVAPYRFQGALRNMGEPSVWMPLSARSPITRIPPRALADESSLQLFARLAPGASRDQGTAFARQVAAQALPDSAARVGMARSAEVRGLYETGPLANHEALQAIGAIMMIGALILLVAWTNVSSLMVAAAVGRRHEIAVRLSLGASRLRLLGQLVTESTLLALAGGALGLTATWWALTWMSKNEIDGVDVVPDVGTFAFVMGLVVVCGILFGLSPALHATREGMASAMRDSGKGATGRSKLQRGFVVAQIVLSQPLLVFLGVLLSLEMSDYKPLPADMSRHVIGANFRPVKTGAPSQRPDAVDSLMTRIATRPEVASAVMDAEAFDVRAVTSPSLEGRGARPDSTPRIVHLEGAAPGWFALVDVPIILGRDVTLADTASADRPIVIGSDLARALWAGANPIGRRLASPVILAGQDSIEMTVVGVYDATRQLPGMGWNGTAARTNVNTRVFTAYGKHWRHDRILVRTRGPAAPWLPELQTLVRAEAPTLPVTGMRTLAQADEALYREVLKETALAGGGGLLALLLASLGLYGVVSLAVQQRTREIGIRIAVGANPTRVARMFLASGVRVSALALLLGLPLSVAGLHVALRQGAVIAPGTNPYLIGLAIAAILLAVAAAATWIPARRASLVDPSSTLREE